MIPFSPVYIHQKRRDLEQIATEGFLGSSWSVLSNILKVAENPKLHI
jgi:hypothetical protein